MKSSDDEPLYQQYWRTETMSYQTKQTNQTKTGLNAALNLQSVLRGGRNSIFLLMFLFLLKSPVFCQLTSADIVGTVTDATGAVVPNADITLTNLGTNEKRTTRSNGSGDYNFTLLQVGHYSLTVKAGGFQVWTTKDLSVEAGDRARADIHLQRPRSSK
jgi:hypothetical protein